LRVSHVARQEWLAVAGSSGDPVASRHGDADVQRLWQRDICRHGGWCSVCQGVDAAAVL